MNHHAELDVLLEDVEAAGLVEQYVDDDGQEAMRLTPEGVRVARQLAMLGEDGQDALMSALLGDGSSHQQTTRVKPSAPSSPTFAVPGVCVGSRHRLHRHRWRETI